MTLPLWTAVDGYITGMIAPEDDTLAAALADSAAAKLPAYQISAPQGQFLYILARAVNARRILEIGTLGGYSTIWMARALPADGRLITLEVDANCAAVARKNFARAGLADKIELREGRALDLLPQLAGPFDLTFIDADKQNNPDYFMWALKYAPPGGIIVVDNVIREGTVIEENSDNSSVRGVRRMIDLIAAEPRVTATALQTVGNKGHDGFLIAVVH